MLLHDLIVRSLKLLASKLTSLVLLFSRVSLTVVSTTGVRFKVMHGTLTSLIRWKVALQFGICLHSVQIFSVKGWAVVRRITSQS